MHQSISGVSIPPPKWATVGHLLVLSSRPLGIRNFIALRDFENKLSLHSFEYVLTSLNKIFNAASKKSSLYFFIL